ncbi:MAG: ExbD/TolR family protein [Chthoniobacteraceae bacterium]
MTPIPSPRSKRRARIEIIPLIDIVFFLLATFVMVSLSMIKNQGISLNLPTASTAAPQAQEGEASAISIQADGQIYFDKTPLAPGELEPRLAALKAQRADPRVVIHGDVKSEFGAAIAVLDAVRKAGIAKVAIQTQPAPQTPQAPSAPQP